MAELDEQARRPNHCCGRVLMWQGAIAGLTEDSQLDTLRSYYQDTLLLEVDYYSAVVGDPAFDINDYGLIFIFVPTSVPAFWTTITDGDWHPCQGPRRVHICGEYQTLTDLSEWQPSFETIAGWAGFTITPTDQDCCCNDSRINPVLPHHLTDGVTRLHMACTSKISNGTPISTTVVGGPFSGCSAPDPATEGPGDVWIAGATKDGVDVIASGDSSHLIGACTANPRFTRNLWAVKTP